MLKRCCRADGWMTTGRIPSVVIRDLFEDQGRNPTPHDFKNNPTKGEEKSKNPESAVCNVHVRRQSNQQQRQHFLGKSHGRHWLPNIFASFHFISKSLISYFTEHFRAASELNIFFSHAIVTDLLGRSKHNEIGRGIKKRIVERIQIMNKSKINQPIEKFNYIKLEKT